MLPLDSGGSGIPPGDPGTLFGVAGQLSAIATSVNSVAIRTSSVVASTNGSNWSSPAAQIFATSGGVYATDIREVGGAVGLASSAIKTYAAALQAAQAKARAALAAQATAVSDARIAQARLASATPPPAGSPPSAIDNFNASQARAGQSVQDTLTSSLTSASNALIAAQAAATAAARVCAAALEHAVTQLAPLSKPGPRGPVGKHDTTTEHKDWITLFAGWFGTGAHVNDYLGGAATALVKQFEHSASALGKSAQAIVDRLTTETTAEQAIASGALSPEDLAKFGQQWDTAIKDMGSASNPFVQALTRGLTSGDGGWVSEQLGKVPVIGAVFTAADVLFNLHDGKSVAYSVGVPVANLAVGSLTSDLLIGALASAEIPVAGEVVLAGAAAVVVTMAVDKGVNFVWDHRAAIEHAIGSAANQVGQWGVDVYNYGADVGKFGLTVAGDLTNGVGAGIDWTGHQLSGAIDTLGSGLSTVGNALDPANW